MKHNQSTTAGFTLVEVLIVVVLLVLIAGSLGLIFLGRAKNAEESNLARIAQTGADNALEALSNLPREKLPAGGSFEMRGDTEIEITDGCSADICDWLTVPLNDRDSPAKGVYYRSDTPPENFKSVLLRRWRVDDLDTALGLKRITVVVSSPDNPQNPLAMYRTTVVKP